MSVDERDPKYLIENNYLEKCEDFEHEGRKVLGSRLGYRITKRFVNAFFGRVFNQPHIVFTEEMLRPGTAKFGTRRRWHGQYRQHAAPRGGNVLQ